METKQAISVLEETRTFHHGIGLRGELTLESVIRYRAAVAIEWIKEDLRRGVQPGNVKPFLNCTTLLTPTCTCWMKTTRYRRPVISTTGKNLMYRACATNSYG